MRIVGGTGSVEAPHSHLVESLWESPTLDLLDLTGAVLTDLRLTDPRITQIVARESRWRDVEITGGRIGTLDLTRAELDGVVIRGIRIDYLALPSASVRHVRLIDCDFGTIDFPDARVERVACDGCRADEVDTRGLRAAHTDLRGIEVLSFTDMSALRGVTLSSRQVEQHSAALASALGIRTQD